MHCLPEVLFTFLYTHMEKILELLLECNLFSSKSYCTAFPRSVKSKMAPQPMPRDYLDAFKFPLEPRNIWFLFRD